MIEEKMKTAIPSPASQAPILWEPALEVRVALPPEQRLAHWVDPWEWLWAVLSAQSLAAS